MRATDLLAGKKEAVLKHWRDGIVDTYPSDATRLFRDVKDRFANPVGYAISTRSEEIYDEVLGEMDRPKLLAALDGLLRIRSVQDFTPSQAVGFVFGLKAAVRQVFKGDAAELHGIDQRIDEVALMAFDVYSQCREEIAAIRLKEVKRASEFAARGAGEAAGKPS